MKINKFQQFHVAKHLVFNRNSFRLSCESKLVTNINKNTLLNISINVFTNKFYVKNSSSIEKSRNRSLFRIHNIQSYILF